MSGPLAGIRVLDLSRILAAPLASQMLGDFGASVIKVERPGDGDDARLYGPPFLGDPAEQQSGFFLSANRNKKSITIDHSRPEGAALIADLADQSDVLLENFRTGVLAKYGLDHETLRRRNPGLIYCSVTGFGQDGPYAARAGYDGVFQAMCGMMSVSGVPDGEPGAGPMKVGVSMVDVLTGLYATSAVLAALHHRDTAGGTGQFIDLALLDCGLASLSHYAQNYLVSGAAAPRRGNGGFGGIPSQSFACADAEIFVVASTPRQWQGLASALERPDLATDPRFDTVTARIANRNLVLDTIGAEFRKKPAAYWVQRLDDADVPVSAVNSMDGVFRDPQIRHRAMRQTLHADGRTVDVVANPVRFSGTPIEAYTAPPRLGAHTDEVLSEVLGKSREDIEKLRADKAI